MRTNIKLTTNQIKIMSNFILFNIERHFKMSNLLVFFKSGLIFFIKKCT